MFALILSNEKRHVKDHCCREMTDQVNMHWSKAKSPLLGSTDQRIYWSPVYDEYGLICQPSAEILKIHYCPFCGGRLPDSRRDAWFKRLAITGWKTWGDPVPDDLLKHDWQ
jgi:hypothetical protein